MPSKALLTRPAGAFTFAVLTILFAGYSIPAAQPGEQSPESPPGTPVITHPGSLETLFHTDALFQTDGRSGQLESSHGMLDMHAQGHARDEDKIIHLTDYLYREPSIKEAYEEYLRLRDQAPHELQVMQDEVVYEVGDTREFFVYNLEESEPGAAVFDEILFELRAIGEKSEIWVEQDEYQPGKIDDGVVDSMMIALEERTPPRSVNPEQGIILNNIDIFAEGNPGLVPDPAGTGKVKVLISDIQDGWDPDTGGGYTAGFFNPGDLAPRTSNSNSNEAAILYINSYPGIYTDDMPTDPSRPLSTVAHEFQHLIQAGRGNLITFMDEGQSEIAEIFNGFGSRSMVFLNDPDEVSGNVESQEQDGFLRWRTGEPEVLEDYQRAQLFHGYLYERIGLEAVGGITQSASGSPWVQYQRAIDKAEEDLEFRQVLTDFYIANWLNDVEIGNGLYGYTLPQFSGVRVSTPGRRFDSGDRPWVTNQPVRLRYGGAKYTNWRDVEDLTITLNSPSEIRHYVVAQDEHGDREVMVVDGDEISLSGMYVSVVLVSVNPVVQSASNYGSREFSYDAEWTPGEVRVVDINYAVNPLAGYVPMPMQFDEQTTFRAISVRVDPEYDGELRGVDVDLWHTDDAIEGSGVLRVALTESEQISGSGTGAVFAPSDAIAYVDLDFDELTTSTNEVDFSDFEIEMEAGRNYHFVFEVMDESDDASLLFAFDQGSNDESDANYYPVRTLLAGFDADGGVGWSRLMGDDDIDNDNDHKNLVMNTRILSRVPVDEDTPGMVETDKFELLRNYPNPFFESTEIDINIPDTVEDRIRVRVELYDVTGRRVGTIFNEELQAGVSTISFQNQNLASGVYIARMHAGDHVDTHKMTILRGPN
ncbi:T9SS type A sorting domain-containing protein [Natronogracilivirga saccharolytica]|uniref:T9SS type A sorting domain-containing protein n=1 Tax=Natronogracilivirga saccharolytica TaxID=2812953 RepID=A0A8J7RN95_9BACT|nr:T9SS type A sorting domain-containing protein [Natronogracilivirga saccharolytica]MBP3192859.1 T9SS type A sorting domain-containing protein [Natronogracilivirga saccharolytica]